MATAIAGYGWNPVITGPSGHAVCLNRATTRSVGGSVAYVNRAAMDAIVEMSDGKDATELFGTDNSKSSGSQCVGCMSVFLPAH
jgi:hypothetical protein